jgi:hypothetical protein
LRDALLSAARIPCRQRPRIPQSLKELRLLCRDELTLIEQRTAFITQLRHALAEYYPTALETFEN